MPNRCKITVIKCSLQEDLIERFHGHVPVPFCPQFREGQEFYATTTQLPDDFCAWAFGDISRDLALVAYDCSGKTSKVTCCTSGFHNVYFYIEAIGETGNV